MLKSLTLNFEFTSRDEYLHILDRTDSHDYRGQLQRHIGWVEDLTFSTEGSGKGHWIGRSISRGSEGCLTGLNSTANSTPWGVPEEALSIVASEFGGNTSLSSCNQITS